MTEAKNIAIVTNSVTLFRAAILNRESEGWQVDKFTGKTAEISKGELRARLRLVQSINDVRGIKFHTHEVRIDPQSTLIHGLSEIEQYLESHKQIETTRPKKPDGRGRSPKEGKGTGRKRQNPEKGAMVKTSFTLHQETIDWLESQGNKSAIVRQAVAEYRQRLSTTDKSFFIVV